MGLKPNAAECDICGAERLEANHWFVASVTRFCGSDDRPDSKSQDSGLVVVRFTEEYAAVPGAVVLCGEACVHTWIAQNIAAVIVKKVVDNAPASQ